MRLFNIELWDTQKVAEEIQAGSVDEKTKFNCYIFGTLLILVCLNLKNTEGLNYFTLADVLITFFAYRLFFNFYSKHKESGFIETMYLIGPSILLQTFLLAMVVAFLITIPLAIDGNLEKYRVWVERIIGFISQIWFLFRVWRTLEFICLEEKKKIDLI